MSLLADRCLRRSFLVQEMYETWQLAQKDHHPVAAELEEIAAECVELCRLLVRAWAIRAARALFCHVCRRFDVARQFVDYRDRPRIARSSSLIQEI